MSDIEELTKNHYKAKEDPKTLSFLCYVRYSNNLIWMFSHETILHFFAEICAYHIITTQFSDIFEQ